MLIDFTVQNFRSFNGEQRLSFVASNYDKSLPENLIGPGLPGLEDLKLLKGLALYGANAAGKTNALVALQFLSSIVENSATGLDSGDPTGIEPFALDPETLGQPSEFTIRFVADGVRYHFALILGKQRVLYESLSAFPKGREQVWYERSWDEDAGIYQWKPDRPTDFKRDPKIVEYTRDNALFLSTAVKWNNKELEPVYLWFKNRLRFLRLNADFPSLSPGDTVRLMNQDPNISKFVVRLLQHADFGILSAKASERELDRDKVPARLSEAIVGRLIRRKQFDIELGHRGAGGKEFPIPWKSQSMGTKKFFSLAGPWLELLAMGHVALIDEIESSMHPTMVVELLRLFFSSEASRTNAQLLFTTHNPLLLDPTLIRRDQVWFADKDEEGATHLYPLTDYKPRKGESLARGYLAGRYGAVPFIPSGLLGKETVKHGG